MLFSSLSFLTIFLPFTVAFYFISNNRFIRNIILLIASLLFYAWGEPSFVFLMILVVAVNFQMVLLIDKLKNKNYSSYAKYLFIVTLILNFACLGFFKYLNFFIENLNLFGLDLNPMSIRLPIGISFYIFQIVSYVIDAYYERVKVQRRFYLLLTYTCLFPQLIAGPIVRYSTVEDELLNRKESLTDFNTGLRRFIVGLGKKVIIANNVALVANHVFQDIVPTDLSFTFAWIGIISYTLQIYFDFSAYSDMAIGLGKIFGFHFLENFNYPYIAKSITDFWRRWHISLSTWFRDYVYIPLGGNRVSKCKLIRNILFVWMLTGFWHGASWNFILWGLYFSLFLILEKFFFGNSMERVPIVSNIYTLFIVMISWIIFNTSNMTHFLQYISALFNFKQGFDLASIKYFQYLYVWPYLIIGIIGSTPLFSILGNFLKRHFIGNLILEVSMFLIIYITLMFLVNDSYNPFIYFRF